jgi:hypothetical protein
MKYPQYPASRFHFEPELDKPESEQISAKLSSNVAGKEQRKRKEPNIEQADSRCKGCRIPGGGGVRIGDNLGRCR